MHAPYYIDFQHFIKTIVNLYTEMLRMHINAMSIEAVQLCDSNITLITLVIKTEVDCLFYN